MRANEIVLLYTGRGFCYYFLFFFVFSNIQPSFYLFRYAVFTERNGRRVAIGTRRAKTKARRRPTTGSRTRAAAAAEENASVRLQVHAGPGHPAGAARRRPVVQHVHPPVPGQHGRVHTALRVSASA